MCCRYLLFAQHYREILRQLGIDAPAEFASRYNIAPGSAIPAVRNGPEAVGREIVKLHWGFVPAWSASDRGGTGLVNARAETLAAKPAFRDALKTRRCVIPASGFYEWETTGRGKKPWLFRWRDERPFGLAGLWERGLAPDGTVRETCAVITAEPNELMRPLHHRMPVMLTPEQFAPWLDPRATGSDQLAPLLQPPPAAAMTAVALGPHVSNVRHEGPDCLAPADSVPDEAGTQFSLGL